MFWGVSLGMNGIMQFALLSKNMHLGIPPGIPQGWHSSMYSTHAWCFCPSLLGGGGGEGASTEVGKAVSVMKGGLRG